MKGIVRGLMGGETCREENGNSVIVMRDVA